MGTRRARAYVSSDPFCVGHMACSRPRALNLARVRDDGVVHADCVTNVLLYSGTEVLCACRF